MIEDDPALQYFYKRILTLNGLKLAGIAKNGEKAVSMFKSFSDKPKVILMDYNRHNFELTLIINNNYLIRRLFYVAF